MRNNFSIIYSRRYPHVLSLLNIIIENFGLLINSISDIFYMVILDIVTGAYYIILYFIFSLAILSYIWVRYRAIWRDIYKNSTIHELDYFRSQILSKTFSLFIIYNFFVSMDTYLLLRLYDLLDNFLQAYFDTLLDMECRHMHYLDYNFVFNYNFNYNLNFELKWEYAFNDFYCLFINLIPVPLGSDNPYPPDLGDIGIHMRSKSPVKYLGSSRGRSKHEDFVEYVGIPSTDGRNIHELCNRDGSNEGRNPIRGQFLGSLVKHHPKVIASSTSKRYEFDEYSLFKIAKHPKYDNLLFRLKHHTYETIRQRNFRSLFTDLNDFPWDTLGDFDFKVYNVRGTNYYCCVCIIPGKNNTLLYTVSDFPYSTVYSTFTRINIYEYVSDERMLKNVRRYYDKDHVFTNEWTRVHKKKYGTRKHFYDIKVKECLEELIENPD